MSVSCERCKMIKGLSLLWRTKIKEFFSYYTFRIMAAQHLNPDQTPPNSHDRDKAIQTIRRNLR